MSGCVPARRVVAAPDPAALEADPQVQPLRPGEEAVLTPGDVGRQLCDLDLVQVATRRRDVATLHPADYRMRTGVPTGMSLDSRMMARLGTRTHPWEGLPGMSPGWLVPWIPTTPPPGHSLNTE